MSDILDRLARSAMKRIDSGYYERETQKITEDTASFTQSIEEEKLSPVVGEIKPGSPTKGKLLSGELKLDTVIADYIQGGVSGLSVLTDPDHFHATLGNLSKVSKAGKPVLMKDFILDHSQIEAGANHGADAVLLIYNLFVRRYPVFELEEAISHAHQLNLEVLLEVNTEDEYKRALDTEADMIGINNRNLRNLEVDLSTTQKILNECKKDRPVWSMSGISGREDVNYLESAGADVFLVGTSLMEAGNRVEYLKGLRGVNDGES